MSTNLDDSLNGHQSILGVCWLIYGALRLIMGILLIPFSPTATVMFGALLTRVPNPYALMADFHFLYVCVIVLSILCGVLGILAGVALLASQRSARMFTIVAAFLSISDIPLGLTLGIYTLIVAFSSRWAANSTAMSSATERQLKRQTS
jgi:hypothetical protein